MILNESYNPELHFPLVRWRLENQIQKQTSKYPTLLAIKGFCRDYTKWMWKQRSIQKLKKFLSKFRNVRFGLKLSVVQDCPVPTTLPFSGREKSLLVTIDSSVYALAPPICSSFHPVLPSLEISSFPIAYEYALVSSFLKDRLPTLLSPYVQCSGSPSC